MLRLSLRNFYYNVGRQRVLKESADSNITGYLYDIQRLLNDDRRRG